MALIEELWYKGEILKDIEKESREWLKNKIEESKRAERCETTIK